MSQTYCWASSIPVRYASTSILLILMVASCAHDNPRDAKLREQVVGSWSCGGSAKMTCSPDGRWQTLEKSVPGPGMVRTEGRWSVTDGALITKVEHVYGTNFFPTVNGGPDRFEHRILSVDGEHLAVLIEASQYHGAKTNLWERKQ